MFMHKQKHLNLRSTYTETFVPPPPLPHPVSLSAGHLHPIWSQFYFYYSCGKMCTVLGLLFKHRPLEKQWALFDADASGVDTPSHHFITLTTRVTLHLWSTVWALTAVSAILIVKYSSFMVLHLGRREDEVMEAGKNRSCTAVLLKTKQNKTGSVHLFNLKEITGTWLVALS